jgi:hypothetical protein
MPSQGSFISQSVEGSRDAAHLGGLEPRIPALPRIDDGAVQIGGAGLAHGVEIGIGRETRMRDADIGRQQPDVAKKFNGAPASRQMERSRAKISSASGRKTMSPAR